MLTKILSLLHFIFLNIPISSNLNLITNFEGSRIEVKNMANAFDISKNSVY